MRVGSRVCRSPTHCSERCRSLNSSMLEYHIVTLATEAGGQFDMPVACYGCPSGGGLAASKQRHESLMPGLNACARCLKASLQTGAKVECTVTCPWKQCVLDSGGTQGKVCDRCKDAGVTSSNPFQRPCAQCIKQLSLGKLEQGQCVCRRLHALFLASDCESREMSLMKSLAGGPTFPAPDVVHLLKSVRSGLYWWWCINSWQN